MKITNTVSGLLLLLLFLACSTTTQKSIQAKKLTWQVFQIEPPASIERIDTRSVAMMTRVVEGNFICNRNDFYRFISRCTLINDTTIREFDPGTYRSSFMWEFPVADSLLHLTGSWSCDGMIADGILVFCPLKENKVQVFYSVVYEAQKQTGFSGAVKAEDGFTVPIE